VIVNHGEEKASLELEKLIREEFHFKTVVPHRREKKVIVGAEEAVIEEMVPSEMEEPETLSRLFTHLDRDYKMLRES